MTYLKLFFPLIFIFLGVALGISAYGVQIDGVETVEAPPRILWLFAGIFFVAGVLVFIAVWKQIEKERHLKANGIYALAKVIGRGKERWVSTRGRVRNRKEVWDRITQKDRYLERKVVDIEIEFSGHRGQFQQVDMEICPTYIGDEIPILYDPQNPSCYMMTESQTPSGGISS